MTEEMNVPVLRFHEFDEEWNEKKLGDIADVSKLAGYEYTKHVVYSDVGRIIALRALNIKNNALDLREVKYIDESDFSKLSRSKLYIGDLMFTYIGANIGDVALINENDRFYLAPNVARIRSNKDVLNYSYLIQYFNIPRFLEQEISGYIASSSQPALSMESIRKFRILTPLLSEQTKIASFLTAVDEKLQALKKKKSLLEEYKKGMMQKLFSQELRFKDDDGNDFPDWEEKGGNEIFKNVSDKEHNSDLPILAITQEHGAIPRDLIEYNISVTDKSVESYKVVQIGDYIISLRSFQGGIEYSSYKGICSPAYIILRPFIEIDRHFFRYFLKTGDYIKKLNQTLEGIRDGKMISYKNFSDVKLPYPSINEQTKISNFLSAIDEKISQTQVIIEKTTDWKKGLLQKMFV